MHKKIEVERSTPYLHFVTGVLHLLTVSGDLCMQSLVFLDLMCERVFLKPQSIEVILLSPETSNLLLFVINECYAFLLQFLPENNEATVGQTRKLICLHLRVNVSTFTFQAICRFD